MPMIRQSRTPSVTCAAVGWCPPETATRQLLTPEQATFLDSQRFSRRLVWKGRPWRIPITEEMLTLADSHTISWRIDWRTGISKNNSQKSGSPDHAMARKVPPAPNPPAPG